MTDIRFESAAAVPVPVGQAQVIAPGGLPGTTIAPITLAGVIAAWLGEVAGAGATWQNQADATLGYNGFRMQCAPAAQNISRMHSSSAVGGYSTGTASLLSGAVVGSRVYLESRLALIRTGSTDAFHAHMGINSTYITSGGFLGLYASDVSPNWWLAFLSGAAAFNFPFPVPQRLVDTGLPFTTVGVYRVEVISGAVRILFNGTVVAAILAPTLSANEWTVVTGTAAIPSMAQLAISKAAGTDTVTLWVPDGRIKLAQEPV